MDEKYEGSNEKRISSRRSSKAESKEIKNDFHHQHLNGKEVPEEKKLVKRASQKTFKDLDLEENYEQEYDKEVEEEFIELLRKPNQGEIKISSNPTANRIVNGFKINWMNMRDGHSGRLIWQSDDWGNNLFDSILEAHIPKSILQCRAISREINFTSTEIIENFRLEQRVYFRGMRIEEWFFTFGFVIPGSTNSWQQIIEAAAPEDMYRAEELSGNVTFETSFYDDDLFICKNLVKIYYD